MSDLYAMLNEKLAHVSARALTAETRLRDIDAMLESLGVTVWETDRSLHLIENAGHRADPAFLRQHVRHLYESAYGVRGTPDDPVAAHRDARRGRSVTFLLHADAARYAVVVEPRCEADGDRIVGTVGLALRLEEGRPPGRRRPRSNRI